MSAGAVYLDIHGVMLDFIAAVEDRFNVNIPNDGRRIPVCFTDLPSEQFWQSLNHPEFWSSLPRIGAGLQLFHRLRQLSRDLRFPLYALTRPMQDCPLAYPGTVEALIALGFRFDQIVVAHDKAACAPGFLIDDELGNLAGWKQAGGAGFLWPARWNGFRGYSQFSTEDAFEYATADLISALLSWHTHTPIKNMTPQLA